MARIGSSELTSKEDEDGRGAQERRRSVGVVWRFACESARPSIEQIHRAAAPLCAGCRTREARYGFRDKDDDPSALRPRTLCFDCFRMEITWRQDVAARWRAAGTHNKPSFPLEATLSALTRRRRRAQIAARHALEPVGLAITAEQSAANYLETSRPIPER